MSGLSELTLAICAEHLAPSATRCARCPIRDACTAPVPTLTHETIDAHARRVNEAAEAAGSQQ